MKDKKQHLKAAPPKKGPVAMERRIDLSLRMVPQHADQVTRAAALDAQRRGSAASRNDFCVAAVLAAARKVLEEA